MDLTLHISAELRRALVLRAATENKPLEDVFIEAAAHDLGVSAPNGTNSNHSSTPVNERGAARVPEGNQLEPSCVVNEHGAIMVRPVTTDADGNPLPKRRDLSFLSEGPSLEPEVIQALEDQRQIDPELWQ